MLSAGLLNRIKYMSCTMRPSARTTPCGVKKSSTGVDRIRAITVFASAVPASRTARR